jgi:hypothetical protein
MKRTILIGSLTLTVFFLTGCGQKTADESKDNSNQNTNSVTNQTPPPSPKTETYFIKGRDFSDKVAWVQRNNQVSDKSSTSYASTPQSKNWELIDDKGKTKFSLRSGEEPMSDFVDGAAVIKTTNEKQDVTHKLIDKNGDIIFPKGEDSNGYRFVVWYGKYYFAVRHVNTFDKTEDQTGIVDNTGSWVLEPTHDLKLGGSLTTATEAYGIINHVYYHDNNFYDAHANEFFRSDEKDGDSPESARRYIKYAYGDGLVFLHKTDEDKLGFKYPTQSWDFNVWYKLQGQLAAGAGFTGSETGFYDTNNKPVIDLSSYEDVSAVGGFTDGYCPLFVENQQDSKFSTVIDKKGSRMFEPIPVKIGQISCGRILANLEKPNEQYYIDVSGKTVISSISDGSDFSDNCLAKVAKTNQGGIVSTYYIDADGKIAF